MKQTSQLLLSIIIVNWNGYTHLVNCLNSLQHAKLPKDSEIIIVDNGSTDKSVSFLRKYRKEHPGIELVENKTNLGYAEGNNTGIDKSSGKYILFLNNDTLAEKNFVTTLLKKIESNDRIGAVQPKILMYPNDEYVDSIGSYFMDTGFLYHPGHNKKDTKKYNKAAKIFTMKGACMLFRKEVLEKVGFFDDKYFAYFEETDLCQRALMAGYEIWYIPDAVIYHIGGETSKHLPSAFVQFHSYKNRIYTYLKNFEITTIVRILPLHILLCEVITVLYFVTLRPALGIAIQHAIFWNFLRIGFLFKERKQINKLRKRSDGIYLPSITRQVRPSYYYHLFTTSLAGYSD